MRDQLNILVLSGDPPYPPTYGGDRIRLYHVLKHLVRQHKVTLLTLYVSEEDKQFLTVLEQLCHRVLAFPRLSVNAPPNWRDYIRSPYYKVAYSTEAAKALQSELKTGQYDLIHADGSRMAVYTPLLRGFPKVIAACDSSTLARRGKFKTATGLTDKLKAYHSFRLMQRHEAGYFKEYDAAIMIAEPDAAEIRRLCPHLPIHCVPNGVESDYFRPDLSVAEESNSLVFTGTMDYLPNVDAALWFAREILPIVRTSQPDVRWEIVGRNPAAEVSALAALPNVTVTGFAQDLRPHLAKAEIYICPIRWGAGMKNKLLEAMAMGKAIVTTRDGISGNEALPGRDLLVADHPAEFAAQILRLQANPQQRRELGLAARRLIEAKYSWAKTAQRFHEIYHDVLAKREILIDAGARRATTASQP